MPWRGPAGGVRLRRQEHPLRSEGLALGRIAPCSPVRLSELCLGFMGLGGAELQNDYFQL